VACLDGSDGEAVLPEGRGQSRALLTVDGREEVLGGNRILTTGRASPRWARTASLAAVLGLACGAALVSLLLPHGPSVRGGSRDVAAGNTVKLLSDKGCHTAVHGESCWTDVTWAREHGILEHFEWYDTSCHGLKKDATFEEFQACVYKINQTNCPLPCNPAQAIRIPEEVIHERDHSHSHHTHDEHAELSAPCHIARKGEDCYDKVLEAMRAGFDQYSGLTKDSSFEDFQLALHKDIAGAATCPRPCECHTALPSESCYTDVVWAMGEGIHLHPTWYHGVDEDSTFEEFQEYLHKDTQRDCKRPCSAKIEGLPKSHAHEEEHEPKKHEPKKHEHKEHEHKHKDKDKEEPESEEEKASDKMEEDKKAPCHTAEEGEKCHKDVLFGMTEGIYGHPEWYPHLNIRNNFEEFQAVLHENPKLHCPKPCDCHTAESGEKCHDSIKWVIREGIEKHPKWYHGINTTSRFEHVQARLHEDEHTTCPRPCTPRVWSSPSLFCFAVFRSKGYELDLVKSQVKKGVGVFACDEFAALSDTKLPLGEGLETLKIPPCEHVGVSKDGTAANTLIFMQAWGVIYEDVRWRAHDWILKVDPDAVLLPDRIRTHLRPHTGKNAYVKNCNKYSGPGWPMMFGSLEAFSQKAMTTYYENAERCRTELQWQAWGEDLFMGNCLDMLKVDAIGDFGIIGDNVCNGAHCGDGTTGAYHPFKSEEKWFECYNEATGGK